VTPQARTQGAIEALDLVIAAARDAGPAADTVIDRLFATRRFMGSGDRRAVRALVYDVIRTLGERPATGRAALIGHARAHAPELLAHFGAGGHAPPPLGPGEVEAAPAPALVSAWLEAPLDAALGADWRVEAGALLARAPMDLRANALRTSRDAVAHAFPGFAPTPLSPWGLRGEPVPLATHPAVTEGLVEVQDEGSQLVALATAAAPGETVIDLCAGAGGKTLALAAMMAGRGRIVACDTDATRLRELGPRAQRAGAARMIEARLLDAPREAAALADLKAAADLVLVDAPCSGSGTWRRNPEGRWRLTPERLDRLAAVQDRLLDLGATLVRPGGRLVYAVCSVLGPEGAARADAFLARRAPWRAGALPGLPGAVAGRALLTPRRTSTDGFFIASFTPGC
jgi:16S rRNA (cytosine967-C5)-methyltransferase